MTKLEELKAARNASLAAYEAAEDASRAAAAAANARARDHDDDACAYDGAAYDAAAYDAACAAWAARGAARDDAWAVYSTARIAHQDELKKIQEGNPSMTKLEELKAAWAAADDAWEAADAASQAAWDNRDATWAAYQNAVREAADAAAAAADAAYIAAYDAALAELKRPQKGNPSMTKLEELKAAWDAADAVVDDACAYDGAAYDAAAYDAACAAWDAAWAAWDAARIAYQDELEKTQKENPND